MSVKITLDRIEITADPGGTWVYTVTPKGIPSCTGKPFPCESEAHWFMSELVPELVEFIKVRYAEKWQL